MDAAFLRGADRALNFGLRDPCGTIAHAAARLGDLRRQRQSQDDQRLLPISLHDQQVALIEPAIQRAKPVGSGFALDPQHPVVAERQFEVMPGFVSTADSPSTDELGYRKFNANALPAGTKAAHDTGPMLASGPGAGLLHLRWVAPPREDGTREGRQSL